MSKRDINLFISDILDSIGKIEAYTNKISYEQFIADEKTKDAVVRNLEIIGEAVKNIPDAVKDKYPAVNWRAATGMRDKLIHGYFGVSFFIVWETVKNDLPAFKSEIRNTFKDLEIK
ncbi:MAG: DUF86 domain-containing protein [Deltaproteobacteria bacterium]|nr:DUF86 domain-containing protein [Deltaproteobacteria bacterium]MCL5277622.1 DUF86 domain-containing protein [Deltaproteobacteria bacterium]